MIRLFSLLIISGSVGPFGWADSRLHCEEKLTTHATEMAITPAEAQSLLQNFLKQNGLSLQGDGLVSALGIDLHKVPQIVLFSLNGFFGDSMIFHFSIIDFFRKTFPEVPLKVISPSASVLSRPKTQDFEWDSLPVRFPQFKKHADRVEQIELMRDRLPGFFNSHVQPGAFVFLDLTTVDKADEELLKMKPDAPKTVASEIRRVSEKNGTVTVGLSNLHHNRIMLGVAGVYIWRDQTELQLRKPLPSNVETIYESWLENFALLFGSKAYLRWDNRYFTNEAEDRPLINDILKAQGLAPSKKYAFINLNTFGGDKVRDLIPYYSQLLREMVAATLETSPDLNILVSFPEYQFGPQVQLDAIRLRANYSGRVALLPSSERELVPSLLTGAEWLISYDSGLVHLGSFLPPERVLTIGLTSSGAQLWRRIKTSRLLNKGTL